MIKLFFRTVVCTIILMIPSASILAQDGEIAAQEVVRIENFSATHVGDTEKNLQENNSVETKPLSYGERFFGVSPKTLDNYFWAGVPGFLLNASKIEVTKYTPEQILWLLRRDDLITDYRIQGSLVETVLKKVGLDSQDTFVFESGSTVPAFALDKNIIGICPSAFEGEQEFSFVLGHEAGHLKQHYIPQLVLAMFVIPIVSHYGLTWYDKSVQYLITKIEKSLQLDEQSRFFKGLESFKKIHSSVATSWITKAALSVYLTIIFQKHLEKDADLRAAKALGPEATAGGISFLKKIQKIGLEARESMLSEAVHADTFTSFFTFFLKSFRFSIDGNDRLDIEHPLVTDRIDYLSALYYKQLASSVI